MFYPKLKYEVVHNLGG